VKLNILLAVGCVGLIAIACAPMIPDVIIRAIVAIVGSYMIGTALGGLYTAARWPDD